MIGLPSNRRYSVGEAIRQIVGESLRGKAMSVFERSVGSIEEFYERELQYLKAMYQSEVDIAVPVAVSYCAEYGLNEPRWLVMASAEVHCANLRGGPCKRGRAAGAIARYRQNMIHAARWDAVREVRRMQKELRAEVEQLRKFPNVSPSLLAERTKMLHWVGRDLLRAYECASMILRGTDACGSPETMKTSYRVVQRSCRDRSKAVRYHVLDQRFLRRLGIDLDFNRRKGKKFVPFYDLTL